MKKVNTQSSCAQRTMNNYAQPGTKQVTTFNKEKYLSHNVLWVYWLLEQGITGILLALGTVWMYSNISYGST